MPSHRGIVTPFLVLTIASRLVAQDPGSRITAAVMIVGEKENVAVEVTYERPQPVGRAVLGDIVPFNKPWITGAGNGTNVSCARPFILGDLKIPAGVYSLWTLPTPNGAMLIVSRDRSSHYDPSADVGRVPLVVDTLPQPVEFKIFFRTDRKAPDTLGMQYDLKQSAAMNGNHYTVNYRTGNVQNLVITWDRFRWSLPVKLQ